MICISTTGIIISKHYCQQKLKGISLVQNENSCSVSTEGFCQKENNSCQKGCCESELEYFQADEQNKIFEIEEWETKTLQITVIAIIPFELFAKVVSYAPNFLTYKPPIVLRDISALFQIFRL